MGGLLKAPLPGIWGGGACGRWCWGLGITFQVAHCCWTLELADDQNKVAKLRSKFRYMFLQHCIISHDCSGLVAVPLESPFCTQLNTFPWFGLTGLKQSKRLQLTHYGLQKPVVLACFAQSSSAVKEEVEGWCQGCHGEGLHYCGGKGSVRVAVAMLAAANPVES